jgi:bifunctional non-homologous end joining protein LigD
MNELKPLIPFEPTRMDHIPTGAGWLYQVKWDGVRILSYNNGTQTTLFNRKLRERTLHFPELINEPFIKGNSFITDGEVIALAKDGKPSFHEVMRRDGLRRMERVKEVQKVVPITYMVFDLLYYNGEWLLQRPLTERLELLNQVILPNSSVQPVTSHDQGEALFQVIQQNGMEGIVCKKKNSTYAIDGKDDRWVKIKNYGDVLAVIGGFTLNGGIVNAALLGLHDNEGNLHFIGKVGTGKLSRNDWRELTVHLLRIQAGIRPFVNYHPEMKNAHWVTPTLVVKVQYTEWRIHEGHTLRQPSIQSFVDIPPRECKFDNSL